MLTGIPTEKTLEEVQRKINTVAQRMHRLRPEAWKNPFLVDELRNLERQLDELYAAKRAVMAGLEAAGVRNSRNSGSGR